MREIIELIIKALQSLIEKKQSDVRELGNEAIKLLGEYEGRRSQAYRDSGGELTIGIGHLLTLSERKSGKIIINGQAVKYKDGLNDTQINDLFRQDIKYHEKAINDSVNVSLSDGQYGALVSFSYNVGINAFRKSTLLKKLNSGDYAAVPSQLKRWVYDNGKKVRGLVNRRNKEIKQWESV